MTTLNPTVERISCFLRVASEPSLPRERGVISNDNKLIGVIKFYNPWRQWVLYPEPKTVWSADCLEAIQKHLEKLNRPTPSEP